MRKTVHCETVLPTTLANASIPNLLPNSHKPILVECEFQISPKCRKQWKTEYRVIQRTMARNNGKVICLYCSRTSKFSGRSNPNCKYPNLDDNILDEIDSEEKAYLLGWIASDSHISINNEVNIVIHKRDEYILHALRDIIGDSLPIIDKKEDMKSLSICSKKINERACELLKINPGKKSDIVNFPDLKNDELKWAFIRGLFDGDGSIAEVGTSRSPKCNIASTSDAMKNSIANFYKVPCYKNEGSIEWWSLNALDFLGKIYDNCNSELCLFRKVLQYWDWCSWIPALMTKNSVGKDAIFRWFKTHEDAVPPFKKRTSDSGWDLTLIRKVRQNGAMTLYGAGLKVTPDYGWYFDLIARSNIIDSGYILANAVGVIDRSYTGEILVGLIKIDPSKPDLELPARMVQIVPRPIIHADFVQVDTIDNTERGEGGFGSTGVK